MSDTYKQKSPDPDIFLDTSVPNIARIFDYLIGGNSHFEVDRQAAQAMLTHIPSLGKWVRMRRSFTQEAAQLLYQEGIDQFLDLGSGMPADDHIHAFAPTARVVFSDLNPVAVTYAQAMFANNPQVAYIRGDARQVAEIFNHADTQRLIQLDKPVAIGLNAIMLFLSPADNQQSAQALYDWAPSGSKIFMVFQTKESQTIPDYYTQFQQLTRAAGLPIDLYTVEQALALMKPWQPTLLVPIADFLGLPADYVTETDKMSIGLAFYAVILEK